MISCNKYSVFMMNAQCLLKIVTCLRNTITPIRHYAQSATVAKREKWDLLSAVSLERKPLMARELNKIESEMFNILSAVEFEKSSKSDHEIRLLTDKIKLQELKKGGNKIDLDTVPEKSAQDIEDAAQEELKNFQFASRKTNADKINDIKSTNRHLDRNLLLLVKEDIGNSSHWVLPQGIRLEGETLRQTAERILVEKCGDEIKADFFGNAPIGFYKYKYPKQLREDNDASVGAKIFFFKAQLRNGNVKENKSLLDYQWATRSELNILHKDYHKSVTMFLIDEEH